MHNLKNYLRYLFVFFWNSFFCHFPSYTLRYILLKYVYRANLGRCTIHRGVRFFSPWKLHVGDGTNIQYGCFLDCRGGLIIGDNVDITLGVRILSQYHDIDSPNYETKSAIVSIENYSIIGSYALILPGVQVSEGTVIGAGSVVVSNTKKFSLYAGNPAVLKRSRAPLLSYIPYYKRPFH
ncbi:hypothetical protein CBQ28_22490 [Pseudoalteromonas sp. GCY]|nr:hypothetical protein CBQ28_22490 [Pseudoalteromonas sp. GCY]QQQ67757.1 acyltransferase [Pseudoalteromonas sp. GCY]